MTTTVRGRSKPARGAAPATARLQTIGSVCRALREEFPDVSISKIRYLEDQGLLAPQRTPGGYRLFAEEDVERLRTILRLQRDEFLPLRVIRQELASTMAQARRRRRSPGLAPDDGDLDVNELCRRSGITPALARDLEEFGLVSPAVRGGDRVYTEADVEVALACGRLAGFGISARHLRMFRTGADRAAALVEQVAAAALRSRNPERHQAGLEDLRELGEAAQELSQVLLWKALRRIAAG